MRLYARINVAALVLCDDCEKRFIISYRLSRIRSSRAALCPLAIINLIINGCHTVENDSCHRGVLICGQKTKNIRRFCAARASKLQRNTENQRALFTQLNPRRVFTLVKTKIIHQLVSLGGTRFSRIFRILKIFPSASCRSYICLDFSRVETQYSAYSFPNRKSYHR